MISIVDDDACARDGISGLVQSLGYGAHAFPSPEHFLQCGSLRDTECLITDLHLPGLSGLDLQRELRGQGCCIPVIFITAYPDDQRKMQALNAGAVCFLSKPFCEQSIIECLALALNHGESGAAQLA